MPRRLKLALLTSMGLGWLRPAPGTWGSLPPVALALTLVAFGGGELTRGGIAPVNALLVLLALLAGWICLAFGDWAEKQFGRKDASEIVIDEVAGQSIALLFLPWRAADQPGALTWNLVVAATAFLLFRVMDISKPPPAKSLQRLRGGAGILVDDLIAGLYAGALAQLAARLVLPAVLA